MEKEVDDFRKFACGPGAWAGLRLIIKRFVRPNNNVSSERFPGSCVHLGVTMTHGMSHF